MVADRAAVVSTVKEGLPLLKKKGAAIERRPKGPGRFLVLHPVDDLEGHRRHEDANGDQTVECHPIFHLATLDRMSRILSPLMPPRTAIPYISA